MRDQDIYSKFHLVNWGKCSFHGRERAYFSSDSQYAYYHISHLRATQPVIPLWLNLKTNTLQLHKIPN